MKEVGVVTLLTGRHTERLEAIVRILRGVESRAPALIRERWVRHHVVEDLQLAVFDELRIRQRVALEDQRLRVVVQVHVHAGEGAGGRVLLLPVERDLRPRFVGDLDEQRARAAGRVVDRRGRAGLGVTNAQALRDHPADLGGRVELTLALATLRGEVAHQVLVRVAQDVVALGAVLGEVEGRVLEDGDQVGEALDLLLAVAQLRRVVEVREVRKPIGVLQRRQDLLVDVVADVRRPLERDHVFETGALRDGDRRELLLCVLVADVLDEEQHQHVVLVLAGVHAAAERVATGPERGVELGLLEGHAGPQSRAFKPGCLVVRAGGRRRWSLRRRCAPGRASPRCRGPWRP